MKAFFGWISTGILVFLAVALISCSEDVELFPEENEDQLVVWAYMDGNGQLHRAKVRKGITYSGDNGGEIYGSANGFIHPDSIEIWLSGEDVIRLDYRPVAYPVSEPEQDGSNQNLIYELEKFGPASGQSYQLNIRNVVTGEMTTASIKAGPVAGFSYPSRVTENTLFDFTLSYHPFKITWFAAPITSWSVRIKYLDILKSGDTLYRAPVFNSAWSYHNNTREFPLDYLWSIFNKIISADPKVDFRIFYRFDFVVWSGDHHIRNYLKVAQGYTDNRKQYFSNIENGLGLFYFTDNEMIRNVRPKDAFGSRLSESDSVRHLKFVRQIYEGKFPDSLFTIQNPFTLNIQQP